jgi:hypothetical protein
VPTAVHEPPGGEPAQDTPAHGFGGAVVVVVVKSGGKNGGATGVTLFDALDVALTP